ncbi:MAG: hypothetical protein QOJ21_1080 [Solirubrobacteraceae bacterium]|nr:hypothetical protein [Solirubrobacteraceae bacterium]
MRWLTVNVPGDRGRQLLLERPGPPSMDDATADEVREHVTKGVAGSVVFTTDDCRRTSKQRREGRRHHAGADGAPVRGRHGHPRPFRKRPADHSARGGAADRGPAARRLHEPGAPASPGSGAAVGAVSRGVYQARLSASIPASSASAGSQRRPGTTPVPSQIGGQRRGGPRFGRHAISLARRARRLLRKRAQRRDLQAGRRHRRAGQGSGSPPSRVHWSSARKARAQISTATSQTPAAITVADNSMTIERPIARSASLVERDADTWTPSRRRSSR